MNVKVQTACAWCGPLFALVFFGGMLLAGLIPPLSPGRSADQVAAFWRDDPDVKRVGLVVMMMAAGLTAPFVGVLTVYVRRIEGDEGPLGYVQLIGGALGVVAITVPAFMWMATSFSPGRSPEVTQALDTLAWIPFVANVPPAVAQCVAIGAAVLGDRRERPVFPRWVRYFNLWVAFLFLPGVLVLFFHGGPFGWNGLVVFWVVAALFGGWFFVMSHVLRKAIHERHQAQSAAEQAVALPFAAEPVRTTVPA
ncbi:MAG: lipoprotein [Solirubrobacterales bacterium]|nr:lipoprotein [Solirubrobacterales bacterium]